jgi:hypothetical protein
MTNDLKHRFEQLVAEPPPPSAVPSEAVFARVRSVRRRRTAGVVTLAAAAVVGVAVAAGNLTDIRSEPPVTGNSGTVVTASPSTTPTTTTTGSTSGTTKTAPAGPTSMTATQTTPVQPPLSADVVLTPTMSGRTVTMRVTVSGTVLVPTVDGQNLPADTSFLNLSGGTSYTWGDGNQGGSDGGAAQCKTSKKRTTGRETYLAESHTYTKPGTYTFRYTVEYCGKNGWFNTTKTTELVIK